MLDNGSLYNHIVVITEDYLGPTAERFVSRQIETHLAKEPHSITLIDLPQLIDWLKVSMSLLNEKEVEVHEYVNRLIDLSPEGAQ